MRPHVRLILRGKFEVEKLLNRSDYVQSRFGPHPVQYASQPVDVVAVHEGSTLHLHAGRRGNLEAPLLHHLRRCIVRQPHVAERAIWCAALWCEVGDLREVLGQIAHGCTRQAAASR